MSLRHRWYAHFTYLLLFLFLFLVHALDLGLDHDRDHIQSLFHVHGLCLYPTLFLFLYLYNVEVVGDDQIDGAVVPSDEEEVVGDDHIDVAVVRIHSPAVRTPSVVAPIHLAVLTGILLHEVPRLLLCYSEPLQLMVVLHYPHFDYRLLWLQIHCP